MKTREEHLLDELSDSETLTEWECEFVDSVFQQYEKKGSLSQKQIDILEKIYKEDATRL